ncbi:glycosyl transferase family 2 [Desulfovibrio sp. X2]|uniref:glycosyltransferase family 2 protein n=1 Tax=Desulfovibrio sp. X2 TaxID=941449 RepID=UPI000358EE01|nr:glycosyltransferase family 2 protein [Desulfovibrio sp. X2]EPR41076.1 glycosyl transferase family 2 [Desulfovibrio sp. X2]
MQLLSIVIPAKNEAAGIGGTVRTVLAALEGLDLDVELIVVDDGSTDGTFDAVAALHREDPRVRCVALSRNFGKEAALLAGLRAASGHAVVTMDADLQHPPALIPTMVARWRAGAKVVHAVKEERPDESFSTRLRARLFNYLLEKLGDIEAEGCSDFKLLDAEVVAVLGSRMLERRRFYRGLATWVGFPQVQVGFTVGKRGAGESKFSLRMLVSLAATAIISFSATPLRIVTIFGALTLLLGLGVGGEALWSWFQGEAVSGYATIIITLLIVGSFIMISLGVIGEYIGRIYEEIKDRPSYLVKAVSGFQAASGPEGPRARTPAFPATPAAGPRLQPQDETGK